MADIVPDPASMSERTMFRRQKQTESGQMEMFDDLQKKSESTTDRIKKSLTDIASSIADTAKGFRDSIKKRVQTEFDSIREGATKISSRVSGRPGIAEQTAMQPLPVIPPATSTPEMGKEQDDGDSQRPKTEQETREENERQKTLADRIGSRLKEGLAEQKEALSQTVQENRQQGVGSGIQGLLGGIAGPFGIMADEVLGISDKVNTGISSLFKKRDKDEDDDRGLTIDDQKFVATEMNKLEQPLSGIESSMRANTSELREIENEVEAGASATSAKLDQVNATVAREGQQSQMLSKIRNNNLIDSMQEGFRKLGNTFRMKSGDEKKEKKGLLSSLFGGVTGLLGSIGTKLFGNVASRLFGGASKRKGLFSSLAQSADCACDMNRRNRRRGRRGRRGRGRPSGRMGAQSSGRQESRQQRRERRRQERQERREERRRERDDRRQQRMEQRDASRASRAGRGGRFARAGLGLAKFGGAAGAVAGLMGLPELPSIGGGGSDTPERKPQEPGRQQPPQSETAKKPAPSPEIDDTSRTGARQAVRTGAKAASRAVPVVGQILATAMGAANTAKIAEDLGIAEADLTGTNKAAGGLGDLLGGTVDMVSGLAGFDTNAAKYATQGIDAVLSGTRDLATKVPVIGEQVAAGMDLVGNNLASVGKGFNTVLDTAFNAVEEGSKKMESAFNSIKEGNLSEAATQAAGAISDSTGAMITGGLDAISQTQRDVTANVSQFVKTIPGIGEGLASGVDVVGNALADSTMFMKEKGLEVGEGVDQILAGDVSGGLKSIARTGASVLDTMVNKISEGAQSVVEGGAGIADNIKNKVSDVASSVWGGITSIFGGSDEEEEDSGKKSILQTAMATLPQSRLGAPVAESDPLKTADSSPIGQMATAITGMSPSEFARMQAVDSGRFNQLAAPPPPPAPGPDRDMMNMLSQNNQEQNKLLKEIAEKSAPSVNPSAGIGSSNQVHQGMINDDLGMILMNGGTF